VTPDSRFRGLRGRAKNAPFRPLTNVACWIIGRGDLGRLGRGQAVHCAVKREEGKPPFADSEHLAAAVRSLHHPPGASNSDRSRYEASKGDI